MRRKGSKSMDVSDINLSKSTSTYNPIKIKRPKFIKKEIVSVITNPQIKFEIQKEKLKSSINSNNKRMSMFPLMKPSKPLPKKMILSKKISQSQDTKIDEIDDYFMNQTSFEEIGSNNITPAIKHNQNEMTECNIFDKINHKIYEDKNV